MLDPGYDFPGWLKRHTTRILTLVDNVMFRKPTLGAGIFCGGENHMQVPANFTQLLTRVGRSGHPASAVTF